MAIAITVALLKEAAKYGGSFIAGAGLTALIQNRRHKKAVEKIKTDGAILRTELDIANDKAREALFSKLQSELIANQAKAFEAIQTSLRAQHHEGLTEFKTTVLNHETTVSTLQTTKAELEKAKAALVEAEKIVTKTQAAAIDHATAAALEVAVAEAEVEAARESHAGRADKPAKKKTA